MVEAFRAAMYAASIVTPVTPIGIAPNVGRSSGVMPKSIPRMNRVSATAPSSPNQPPVDELRQGPGDHAFRHRRPVRFEHRLSLEEPASRSAYPRPRRPAALSDVTHLARAPEHPHD